MKQLSAGDYVVRPFLTHKQQTYTYTYLGGANPTSVTVDLAMAPPGAWSFQSGSEPQNADSTYQHTLYASVRNMFYGSGSLWASGPDLDTKFYPYDDQFYVINLAQSTYGDTIQAGTFTLGSPVSTASLYDDGRGHLVSSVATGSVVGNIFYELGIAVIRQATGSFSSSVVSHLGMFMATGSQATIAFKATHTIYEHRVMCTVGEGELNYSSHPSMTGTGSGGELVFDSFANGSLTPYMTTVGLYTDIGELVGIAKFPRSIKRAPETQQSFIIRFDV